VGGGDATERGLVVHCRADNNIRHKPDGQEMITAKNKTRRKGQREFLGWAKVCMRSKRYAMYTRRRK